MSQDDRKRRKREERKKEKAKRELVYQKRRADEARDKAHRDITRDAQGMVRDGLLVIEGEPPDDKWRLTAAGVYLGLETQRHNAGLREDAPTKQEAIDAVKFGTVPEVNSKAEADEMMRQGKEAIENELKGGAHWTTISLRAKQ